MMELMILCVHASKKLTLIHQVVQEIKIYIGIAIGGRHAPEETHVTIIGVSQEVFNFYVCSK